MSTLPAKVILARMNQTQIPNLPYLKDTVTEANRAEDASNLYKKNKNGKNLIYGIPYGVRCEDCFESYEVNLDKCVCHTGANLHLQLQVKKPANLLIPKVSIEKKRKIDYPSLFHPPKKCNF